MEEVNNKYKRFVELLHNTVRPEHEHLLAGIDAISATDMVLLIKGSPRNLSEAQQSIMAAVGLTDEIVESYEPKRINQILRYIEYFFAISNII